MELLPSAHVDTFCRDRLPPADQWPEFLFEPPVPDYPDRLNCATALLDDVITERGGARPCLHAKGSPTWTYDDLRAAANRIAHVLVEDRGLVPGNRVLLRGPNTPWLAACWFAVLKAGGVVVATMPLLRTHELRVISEIAAPGAAISLITRSSWVRSRGIVATTTPPALSTANQQAASHGVFGPRSSTRLPGTSPRSSTSTWAMRLAAARRSSYVQVGEPLACRQGRAPPRSVITSSSSAVAQLSRSG